MLGKSLQSSSMRASRFYLTIMRRRCCGERTKKPPSGSSYLIDCLGKSRFIKLRRFPKPKTVCAQIVKRRFEPLHLSPADQKKVTTYHYVMTQDFPYSASCFRATATQSPGQHSEGQQSGQQGTQQSGGQQQSPPPPKPY